MSRGNQSGDDPPGHDGTKRAFLRSLFSPVAALVGSRASAEPTRSPAIAARRFIASGSEARARALLGPLAEGQAPFGAYRLARVHLDPDRVHVIFEAVLGVRRDDIHHVAIALMHLDSIEGVTHARTRSFRLVVTGDAPGDEMDAIGARVAHEVSARDDGSLWVAARPTP